MNAKQQFELLPLHAFIKKIDDLIKNGLNDIDKNNYEFNKSMESLKRCRYSLGIEFLVENEDKKRIVKGFKAKMLSKESKAFLFGAGISVDKPFNLPLWSPLLQRSLIGDFYKDTEIAENVEYGKFLEYLTEENKDSHNFFDSFDLYELAQYIENNRKQINYADNSGRIRTNKEMQIIAEREMFEIVKTALALKLNKDEWELEDDSFNYNNNWESNNLISKLAECVGKYNVSRILTYNYDNAFEFTCEKVLKNKKIKTILLDEQLAKKNNKIVQVFHVHGYIPLFLDKFSKSKEYKSYLDNPEAKKLILSEDSYDDIEHSSYKWRNVIQIDTFLRYNCIFFGFSATDKNFKRIVKLMDWHSEQEHIESQNNFESSIRHYIFLDIEAFIQNIFKAKLEDIIKDEFDFLKENNNQTEKTRIEKFEWFVTKLQCLYFTLRAKRKYLKKMHIYPIWVTKDKVLEHLEYCLK